MSLLNPKNASNDIIYCAFFSAHTPDNSFLGFVVEQHLNASDIRHIDDIKRQNQSLVYGKVDNFWKVRRRFRRPTVAQRYSPKDL